MRRSFLIIAIAAATSLGAQTQQAALAPNAGVMSAKGVFMVPAGFVRRALEQTPDSLLSFKPTPEIRSLGELFAHVADGEHLFCSLALGEPMMDAGVEKTKKTKAELIQALKDAAAHCDKAYAQNDLAGQTPASFRS